MKDGPCLRQSGNTIVQTRRKEIPESNIPRVAVGEPGDVSHEVADIVGLGPNVDRLEGVCER